MEASNEMKLDSSLEKKKIVGLMWVQGELVSLTCSIRGHIHNNDGCIWDIYDIEKQVFWDFCHDFRVGGYFHLGHSAIYKYPCFPNGFSFKSW